MTTCRDVAAANMYDLQNASWLGGHARTVSKDMSEALT